MTQAETAQSSSSPDHPVTPAHRKKRSSSSSIIPFFGRSASLPEGAPDASEGVPGDDGGVTTRTGDVGSKSRRPGRSLSVPTNGFQLPPMGLFAGVKRSRSSGSSAPTAAAQKIGLGHQQQQQQRRQQRVGEGEEPKASSIHKAVTDNSTFAKKKKRRIRPRKNLKKLRWSDDVKRMSGQNIVGASGDGFTSETNVQREQQQQSPLDQKFPSLPLGEVLSHDGSTRSLPFNSLMHSSNTTLQTLSTAPMGSKSTLAMENSMASSLFTEDVDVRRTSIGSASANASAGGNGGGGGGGGCIQRSRPSTGGRTCSLHSIPDDIELKDPLRGHLCSSSDESDVTMLATATGPATESSGKLDASVSENDVKASTQSQSQQNQQHQRETAPSVYPRSNSFTGIKALHDEMTYKPAQRLYPRSSSLTHTADESLHQLGIDISAIASAEEKVVSRPALIESTGPGPLKPSSARSLDADVCFTNGDRRRESLASRSSADAADQSRRRASDNSVTALSHASWLGSMGDSDLSGSSSDCEGSGPNRQRLRTRRRRLHRPARGGRRSSAGDKGAMATSAAAAAAADASEIIVEGRRERIRRAERKSCPSTALEILRASADISNYDSDSSLDDGNRYEAPGGSRLDAILASAAATVAADNNTNNHAGGTALELNDLYRPNRTMRSSLPRQMDNISPAAHASWPARPANRGHLLASGREADRIDATARSVAAATSAEAAVAAQMENSSTSASTSSNLRRQEESFANLEDLIRASLRQPSASQSPTRGSSSGVEEQGNAYGVNNNASWPRNRTSLRLDGNNSASAAARSESILDQLQNLDLRQVGRDNNESTSAWTFDAAAADNGAEQEHTNIAENPLVMERHTLLGFSHESFRRGDSHRISVPVSGSSRIGQRPYNPPQGVPYAPIRGLDALGEAIGAIAASAPETPLRRVTSGDVASPAVASASGNPLQIAATTGGPIRGLDALAERIGAIAASPPDLPPPTTSASLLHRPSTMSSRGPDTASPPNASSTSDARSAPSHVSSTARAHSSRRKLSNGSRTDPTPLYEAVSSGSDYDTIKSLIALDPGAMAHQNGAGLTPLHCSIERYDTPLSVIRLLLVSDPATASLARCNGRTPLDLFWKRFVDPDSFRIESSRIAANELATLMEAIVSDDGCVRPPKSEDGEDDEEQDTNRTSGLSQRDTERKARAMRILLSNPRLRDFWDLMTLFVRAAHHKTIVDPLPPGLGRWRIVHSCVVTRCEPLLIRFAAALYPEQLSERDERSGRLPLHMTAALSCERSANSIDKTVLRLWPGSAWCHDNDGRLPINLAIEAGKPWRFVRSLLQCAPRAVITRDTKTHMVPFMISATSNNASLDCTYRLLRDSCEAFISTDNYGS